MHHASLPLTTVMRRRLPAVSLLTALWTTPALAQSQDKPDPETAKLMLAYIREANELYKQEQWAKALDLYEKAYALSPQPALLYRMGKSAQNSGQLRVAVGYYEEFVKLLPNEDAAKKVATELPQLRAQIPPVIAITSTPSNANIYLGSLEGMPIGSTPFQGEFPLGEVKILVKLDGYQVYQQSVTLSGAEQEEIAVTLVKQPSDTTTPDGVTEEMTASEARAKRLRRIGLISTGSGIVLLGGGGVMSALMQRKITEVNEYDKQGASNPSQGRAEINELKDDANALWRNSIILYSIGGLATAAGVTMLIIGSKQGETPAPSQTLRLHLDPLKGGARVGVSGSF